MSTEAMQTCSPGMNQYVQVLQALPLLDKNIVASNLYNLEGRREYAHTVGQVFQFLEQAHADTNRPVWLELKGILTALEGWAEYTAPAPKQKKVDRMDRMMRSGRR